MKKVTVEETDVLLARVDGKYHAIGAYCTHYGAPLAQGVLSGTRFALLRVPTCNAIHTRKPMTSMMQTFVMLSMGPTRRREDAPGAGSGGEFRPVIDSVDSNS